MHTETLLPTYSTSIHGESIGLSWSVDGKIVATSGINGESSVFSWNAGKLVKDFTCKNNDQTIVTCLQFSNDGKYFSAASKEGEVLIYDVDTHEAVRESAHDNGIVTIAWNTKQQDDDEYHKIVMLDSIGQIG